MLRTRVSLAFFLCALFAAGLTAEQKGTAKQPRSTAKQPRSTAEQQGAPSQPAARSQQPDPAAQKPPATSQPQTAQEKAAQDAQAVFRGGINFVRVDVIVTDKKAQPITDLKQTDFELLEDNKPQAIQQFASIKVDGNPKPGEPPVHQIRDRDDEEAAAQEENVRIYAIFLDDYHVRRANSISIRDPLIKFIQNQVRPKDMIAVMYPLQPVADVYFTRNVDQVINAINKFEGRKYDYTPRNQFEETYARYPTETVEQIRNDVVMTALRGLSVRLGSMREGRKSVIFVSEGLTATLPPQMRRADASLPQGLTPVDDSPVAQGQEQTYQWFQQGDLYSHMRDIFDAANRNNTSIYSLDPRGLAPFEYDINDGGAGNAIVSFQTDQRALQATQDTLRTLSEQTDGRAITNRNTLLEGLNQIARDSSFYYLIGYTSSQAPTDGKFHEIKVRVKRPGVEIRARRGYWAATTADVEKIAKPTPEVAKPVQQALAAIAPVTKTAGKYVQTWVGTERGANGKTRVTLVWEPLPPTPGLRREQPGRVSVLAADAKGDLVFRGRTPDAALAAGGPPTGPNDTGAATRSLAAPPTNTPHKLVFDAPPGKMELRLTVEGAGGLGTLDNEIKTIDVPDLTAPQAALSTPRVFPARTARDFQALAADAPATPVATREFSRTERLLIRFDAYGAGTERPTVTATLLNRSGQKIADLTVAPATAGGTHQIDFGLNTIPAGEYLVEITAKAGSGEAKELFAVRVTS
jgi:VWFA-related protein